MSTHPSSATKQVKQPTLFLCRANGEGSHEFRVAADEAGVMAFYKDMFGEEHGGGIQGAVDHFRDPDNWSNGGEAYHCELYCATFEVWKVFPSELSVPSESTGMVLDKPAQIGATRFGIGVKWSTVIDRAKREWDYFHGLKNPRSSDIEPSTPKCKCELKGHRDDACRVSCQEPYVRSAGAATGRCSCGYPITSCTRDAADCVLYVRREPQSAEATAAGLTFCCAHAERQSNEIADLRNQLQRASLPSSAWFRLADVAQLAALQKVPHDPRLELPAYERGWNAALREAAKLSQREDGRGVSANAGMVSVNLSDMKVIYGTIFECQRRMEANGERHSWIDPGKDIAKQYAGIPASDSKANER